MPAAYDSLGNVNPVQSPVVATDVWNLVMAMRQMQATSAAAGMLTAASAATTTDSITGIASQATTH